ncbi:transcription factor EGL1 [Corchorus olitorius]|uniref:Transcription factor EGL1 n=1 Tax=Corchorus olitorius TaxID=93759 RepID=A0A1R3FWN7_9ROSI|nr:transcription factor EGL1 [Corchorus olitorius]
MYSGSGYSLGDQNQQYRDNESRTHMSFGSSRGHDNVYITIVKADSLAHCEQVEGTRPQCSFKKPKVVKFKQDNCTSKENQYSDTGKILSMQSQTVPGINSWRLRKVIPVNFPQLPLPALTFTRAHKTESVNEPGEKTKKSVREGITRKKEIYLEEAKKEILEGSPGRKGKISSSWRRMRDAQKKNLWILQRGERYPSPSLHSIDTPAGSI